MATTQRGINIPVTGQFQDGDDIVDALIALGLSVDSAIGSAIDAAAASHNHDSAYYTKTQVDNALSGKADTGHTHTAGDVSGLAAVATSGSYDDLENKPSIPSTPGDVHLEAALFTSANVTLGNFWTVPLNSVVNIGGGSFNEATGIYTLPEDGLYLCVGSFRVQDSADVSTCGIGIGPASADGPDVLWSEFPTVATRKGIRYTRVARLIAGTQLRLYVYVEGTGTVTANTQGTSLTVTKLRGGWT